MTVLFKTLSFFSCLIMILGCATTTPKVELAQLHLKIGTNNLAAGNYPEALKNLLMAETYDSHDPVIQNNLGLAYFMREKMDLSELHIRKAIEIEPKYTEARNNLSRVLIEQKKYEEAESLIRICLQDLTFPQPGKVYSNLGLLKFNEEKFEAARDAFQKSLNFEHDNCLSHNYFGRSLLELKNYTQASVALDRATVQCNKSGFDEPTYFAALAYYRSGDMFKTKERLESIKNPESKYFEKAKGMLKLLGSQ